VTVRLYLVRHGRAAAGWDQDLDPGLDEVGRTQATGVASRLAALGPLPVVTSPLRRARETAAPLAAEWGSEPIVQPAVGEIPSPTTDLAERSAWLREALAGRWADLGPVVAAWRSRLIATVLATPEDTVVFTHFVAINALVGEANGNDAVVVFSPKNGSCTSVDVDGGTLSDVQLGSQAETEIR
jgi:broad specificity phosphatase PhoE